MLHTIDDSQLIRHHTLDCARIMYVTDLIRNMLTSPTPRRNAIAPEMDVISTLTTLTYFATGKTKCSSDEFGSVTTFYKQSDHTNMYSTFRTVLCHCSFLKNVLSMVNKKIKNIYTVHI